MIGTTIQRDVDFILDLTDPIRCVLAHCLRDKFEVQCGLHKRREGVPSAGLKGCEEGSRHVLEKMGKDRDHE